MTAALRDPRAWTAATLDEPPTWYYPLPTTCRALLEEKLHAGRDRPPTELRLSPAEEATCAQELALVRAALEEGRGFAIVTGLPPESPIEATGLYWLLGQGLGRPFVQNVQGTLLYDVRDTGQDLAQGARFSVTRYESSFHTDNSFGEAVLDTVGLLCLQTARSGGINQLVSGWSVLHALERDHPDALAVLGRPFHIDRRGGVREGQASTIQLPVIERTAAGTVFRYLRYWIEAGHAKAGVALTAAQIEALDTLDAVLGRRELWAEFALRHGEALFLNNRWLLHNRTAFEDHPEPERRRHLVRLWLQSALPCK